MDPSNFRSETPKISFIAFSNTWGRIDANRLIFGRIIVLIQCHQFGWKITACLLFSCAYLLAPSSAGAEPAATAGGLPPLSAEEASAYAAIPSDPPPKKLNRNSHFFISDEKGHEWWRPVIDDLGGALIGVGTNQNYALAGWAKSEVLFLVDFDQYIVDLHGAYRVAFETSKTPLEFIAFWSKKRKTRSMRTLKKHFKDPGERKRVLRSFRMARAFVHRTLRRLRWKFRKAKVPCFMADQKSYDYIVDLHRKNRVFAIRGDLTATKTINGIAQSLKRFNREVGIIYVSNAEGYFGRRRVPRQYLENLIALPSNEKSRILRTYPWRAKGDKYHQYAFIHQEFSHLKSWYDTRPSFGLYQMIGRPRINGRAVASTRSPKVKPKKRRYRRSAKLRKRKSKKKR